MCDIARALSSTAEDYSPIHVFSYFHGHDSKIPLSSREGVDRVALCCPLVIELRLVQQTLLPIPKDGERHIAICSCMYAPQIGCRESERDLNRGPRVIVAQLYPLRAVGGVNSSYPLTAAFSLEISEACSVSQPIAGLSKSYPDTRKFLAYSSTMQKRLTSKTVESLPAANGKRYEVRDELVRGLVVRVSITGAKVYWVTAT